MKFLIAGGGLTGTFLAAALCRRGHSVVLADAHLPGAATPVAAGLFNIVTGRLAVKTWMAETLLGFLKDFFKVPPFDSLQELVHLTPIYRPFKTIFEYNEWLGRSADAAFSEIVRFQETPYQPEVIDNPHGGIWILPCGWIDAGKLVPALQNLLATQFDFQFISQKIDPLDPDLPLGVTTFNGLPIQFDHLVFAEGWRTISNPLFEGIDLRPLKGQIMEIEVPGFAPEYVVSKKIYLVPLGNHRFIVGATYERDISELEPTEKGTAELTALLEGVIRLPFKVIWTHAGIRPTSPNRRPILGTHPKHPNIHIVNGMGTKGMLQAPYFGDQMAQYLEGKTAILNRDISLERVFPKNP